MKLVEGKKVTCRIKGVVIKDARLHFECGNWYICQDVKDGTDCRDKLGYRCSWCIEKGNSKDLAYYNVSELKAFASTNIEDVYVGCKIDDGCGERVVLGICGRVAMISWSNNFNDYSYSNTIEQLKRAGFKLVPEEPVEGIIELTIKDISDGKGKGVPAHLIRVKE